MNTVLIVPLEPIKLTDLFVWQLGRTKIVDVVLVGVAKTCVDLLSFKYENNKKLGIFISKITLG